MTGAKRRDGRRRVGRRALRWMRLAGMLAATAAVARKTAGAPRDGRPSGQVGTAGPQPREHTDRADLVADGGRGRGADRPAEIPGRGWKEIAVRVKGEVKGDQIPLVAAGVAFYGLLSLFPAIIATVSVYGLVASPDTVRRQLEQLSSMLSRDTASILRTQIEQVTAGAGGALSIGLLVGILTALWSASSGMKALVSGVNLAYDETETRKFAKLRGLALLLTIGAMALVAVALALIVGLPAFARHLPAAPRIALEVGRWPLLAVLLIVGLAVVYRFSPDRDEPRWAWVSWGSVVATVLWVVASAAFSLYASHFGNYNKTYGTLAGLVILLFWLWLSALVVLVGAELNAEMELQTAKDTTTGPDRPMGERGAHAADHVAASP